MALWHILSSKKRIQVTDLNKLSAELTLEEGLNESLSIGQVKELLALLGKRWREMSTEDFLAEATAIKDRAGKKTRGLKIGL